MVGILYEVVNYGYLNYAQIQHYAEQILKHGEGILRRARRERRERMVEKMVKYLDMAEQIWTIIYSMNILSTIYANLKSSKLTSNHYLVQ